MECMEFCYRVLVGFIPGLLWFPRESRMMAKWRWLHVGSVVIWGLRFHRATELSRAMRGNGGDDDDHDVESAESLLTSSASTEMVEFGIFISNPGSAPAPEETIPSSHASLFMMLDWSFPIANLLLELLSEVFNQISSKRHPHLGLVGLLMSLATLLIGVIELIYRGQKEKVRWRKSDKWDKIYWFFHTNDLPFGTLLDVVVLICSMLQCVFAAIAYAFFSKHVDDPIKLSVWPIAFAFVLLCSKFFNKSNSLVEP